MENPELTGIAVKTEAAAPPALGGAWQTGRRRGGLAERRADDQLAAKGSGSSLNAEKGRRGRAMGNPSGALKGLTAKAQDKTRKFQRLYRNPHNPQPCWMACGSIHANEGGMAAGADGTALGGIGERRMEKIAAALKGRGHQPHPARIYSQE
ncbi:MAG: hypothetical protein LBU32_28765 [Clostridiales bacterium]|jgi:hypothetical protein|nr:hypothetical protein [Clostridiales bacterium]